MTKALRLLAILALCSVIFAQTQRKQLLVTGTVQSSSYQLSFQIATSADTIPTIDQIKFENLNLVAFGVASSSFHNHTDYPISVSACDEKTSRERDPAAAPFWEKQNFGLTFTPSSVRDDGNGNFILSGVAQGSYNLLNTLYPVPTRPCNSEECDHKPARTTTVAVTVRLTSSDGAFYSLQRVARAGQINTISNFNWNVDYSIDSRIPDDQSSIGFKNFRLTPAVVRVPPVAAVSMVINDLSIPLYKLWKSLKVQPIGIRTNPIKICNSIGCSPCCSYIWIPDIAPTGTKGLNFGKPGADTQWKKAGITFDWQPIVYITDGSYKVLDNDAEEDNFYATYSDPTAVEIFFARQFTPASKYGGGFTHRSGYADALIVSTEYMIDDCNKDFTHLAHELGHVLNLPHPPGYNPTSSTNTLMCPSGYCNDNPTRNSRENQDNASNPLITYYFSTASQTADDCTNSADCGPCPF